MPDLTLEERRSIASLVTVKGYQLIIEKVVKCRLEASLTKMKLALSDEKLQHSYEFCAWDTVMKALEDTPKEIMEALKADKDEVYG